MAELEHAVEQFHAAMTAGYRRLYGYDGEMGESEEDIVKALLAAGWRPPEVMSEEPWIKRPDGSSFRRGVIDYFGPRS